MDRSLTVTEARATLPEILDQVMAGDEVTITRHGRSVAVVVSPDALRSRRADAASGIARRLHETMVSARRSSRPEKGLSPRRADELIAEVRAGRGAR